MSLPVCWGRSSGFGAASGVASAFDWQSNPVDLQNTDDLSLTLIGLAETPIAMLVVPSTTAGDGILYVAQASSVIGNNASVAHSAPSGAVTNFAVAGSAIVVAPASGAMNEQVAMLANQNSLVWALVKAYTWGWGRSGPPQASMNSDISSLAMSDLLTSNVAANLLGGAASASQTGTATLQCSDDMLNWIDLPGSAQQLVGSGVSIRMEIQRATARFCRVKWVHTAGSVGQIGGTWETKGGAR